LCSSHSFIPVRGYSGSGSAGEEFLGQRLAHRRVLRISGPDGAAFLQGLITNDVEILLANRDQYASAFYTMILNAQVYMNDFAVSDNSVPLSKCLHL